MRALSLVLLCSAMNAAVCFGAGRCGDAPGDAADIASARAQVDAACVCGAASSRSAYQRCVSGVLAQRTSTGLLRRQCAGSVRRCASKSVCGRPGAVTCCRSTRGQPVCSIRPSAASCQTSGGTPSACPSCCEACTTGCAPPTTTTTFPFTCAGDGFTCNGTCPPGERCASDGGQIPSRTCRCFPDGTPACAETPFPVCGGACLDGKLCQSVSVDGAFRFDSCFCIPPNAVCGHLGGPCGGFGLCPAGQVCLVYDTSEGSLCSCGPRPSPTTTTTTMPGRASIASGASSRLAAACAPSGRAARRCASRATSTSPSACA